MPPQRKSSLRFLPHSLVATVAVLVLPALAVGALPTRGQLHMQLAGVLLAMSLSVLAAAVGSAIWARRPASRDVVFGDLMLWGWLRKVRAERRLAGAHALLGLHAGGAERQRLSHDRLCETFEQLSGQLEARDAYTHGHTKRVTRHAERIAREMGLSPAEVAKVRTAAAVHDVGKVHTPHEVLSKPGRLTDEEFAIIKCHPVDGAEMVAELEDPEVTAMVRHHHERLDGTGYPHKLSGDEIPLGARIISVADTFDAMTSARPYRKAGKHKKALDVLAKEAGSQLDPAAVSAFQRYYRGRNSVAWSAFLLTAPQRALGWATGLFPGASAGTLPLAQGIAALGTAALLGGSLGSSAAPAAAALKTAADRQVVDAQRAPAKSTAASKRGEVLKRAKRDARRKRVGLGHGERKHDGKENANGADPHRPGGGTGGNTQAVHPEAGGGSPGGSAPGGGSSGGGGGGSNGQSPSQPPTVQVPSVQVPSVQVPSVQVPPVQVPEVNPPKVQLPRVNPPQLP